MINKLFYVILLFGFFNGSIAPPALGLSQAVVMDGEYILTIREDDSEELAHLNRGPVEYSVFRYDGDFKFQWKFFSEACDYAFLNAKGATLALTQCSVAAKNDSVFLRFLNKNGLVKEFKLEDICAVSELKSAQLQAFVGNTGSHLLLFEGNYGIMNKVEIAERIKKCSLDNVRTKLSEALNYKDEYFVYITSQNKIYIHNIDNGSIIVESQYAE